MSDMGMTLFDIEANLEKMMSLANDIQNNLFFWQTRLNDEDLEELAVNHSMNADLFAILIDYIYNIKEQLENMAVVIGEEEGG